MIDTEMYQIMRELVEIKSVNGTAGEREIGIFLEDCLREIPYFRDHPEQVIVRELKGDPLHRRNVMALLIGEGEWNPRTIHLHGHTDTVGTEDYGALEPLACRPDELMDALRQMRLPVQVRCDLESGEYLFGRGTCDMKSGDAVFLGILKEMAARPEAYCGNVLLSFNPVEENLHTGIIEGLEILEELKEKYGLEYILAVNNDFICPLFPGDKEKTIYTGTVGKLLPCFYIQGRDTHVGQCFEGFDASLAAAGLAGKIGLNSEFSDAWEGEYTYPPSVLKLKDLKPWYNVQTPAEALVYFNYFVHNASMEEITETLLEAAREVMEQTQERNNRMSRIFCERSGQRHTDYAYPYQVMTWHELWEKAKACGAVEEELEQILAEEKEKGTDQREIPVPMIRRLLQDAGITEPAVVLYYAAPYCPHNTLQEEEGAIVKNLKQIVERVAEQTGEEFRFMHFFPSLSDSSYLKIDDSDQSLAMLVENFPAMKTLYPLPLERIRRLNIPAVNFGCYGKDAHKWTERVNLPYTFEVLPQLLRETIACYLERKEKE